MPFNTTTMDSFFQQVYGNKTTQPTDIDKVLHREHEIAETEFWGKE